MSTAACRGCWHRPQANPCACGGEGWAGAACRRPCTAFCPVKRQTGVVQDRLQSGQCLIRFHPFLGTSHSISHHLTTFHTFSADITSVIWSDPRAVDRRALACLQDDREQGRCPLTHIQGLGRIMWLTWMMLGAGQLHRMFDCMHTSPMLPTHPRTHAPTHAPTHPSCRLAAGARWSAVSPRSSCPACMAACTSNAALCSRRRASMASAASGTASCRA